MKIECEKTTWEELKESFLSSFNKKYVIDEESENHIIYWFYDDNDDFSLDLIIVFKGYEEMSMQLN